MICCVVIIDKYHICTSWDHCMYSVKRQKIRQGMLQISYINKYAGSSNLHDRYVPEKCHDK